MSQNNQYNTIEEALRDLREGKVILVTDDPDRENEGGIWYVQQSLQHRRISILWRLMRKGLSVHR